MSDLTDIMEAMATLEEDNKAKLGLSKVYDWNDELSFNDFPMSLRFPASGTTQQGASIGSIEHYTINVDILVERGAHLASRLNELVPILEGIHDLYADNKSVSGTCEVLSFGDADETGTTPWFELIEVAELKLVGFRLTLIAKKKRAIDVSS